MTNPQTSVVDIIATRILTETQDAIKNLKLFDNAVAASALKVSNLANAIKQMSQQSGKDIATITKLLQEINAPGKSGQFGKLGVSNEAIKQAGRLAFETQEIGRSAQIAAAKVQEMGATGESAFGRVFNSVNAMRIALGALISMLLFQVVQAFSAMVRGALKGLNEIEAATFNIINAEQRLSEQGIKISIEGLDKIIEDIQKLDPMLSKFQATELVSALTTKVAPALRLGEEEISSLAKSITILSVRNQALGKSFEEVETQVITGLLSGKVTAGINQLGLKITDQIVKEQALKIGLVATAKAYENLSAKEQERINALSIISILEENTAQEAENLPKFLKTASGLIGVAKAELSDILTSIGQTFAPILKSVLRIIIQIFQSINEWLEENKEGLTTISGIWAKFLDTIGGTPALIKLIGAAFQLLLLPLAATLKLATAIVEKFQQLAERFPKIAQFFSGGLQGAETPTGEFVPDVSGQLEEEAEEAEKAAEKLQEVMQENADKLKDIELDYQRKLQDIARDYGEKLADIARDAAQKREDAARDYAEKVEDINRNAEEKIAEAQEDAKNKEIEREKEFQRKLKELREKFLFDLEDALRARDARQVLRLIRQYQMDKKNLEERRKLEQEDAKLDLQQKLKDIEEERQQQLREAKRTYEQKKADIDRQEARARADANIWHRRALEDARLWYQRQLADQRQYLQQKLKDLQNSYSQALKMQQQFQNQMSGMTSTVTSGSGNVVSGSGNFPVFSPTGAQVYTNPYDIRTRLGLGFAEGGTLVADKPTLALFGEKGREMVNFTPLDRNGKNTGKLFGDISGTEGVGGNMNLRILLSEGLIAEIINSSLENVSAHIEYTRRSA